MNLQNALYVIPGVLLGLTVHEFCHAYTAFKLGDNTARDMGRVTLNPLKHIDVFGFLFIIIFGFGWAKPVQFNPENLKSLRRDRALIAAAGPFSNLILGTILMFYIKSQIEAGGWEILDNTLMLIIFQAAAINYGLFIFNLLPFPPLDGSHIVFSALNLGPEIESKIMKVGMPLLLVIIIVQNAANINILPIGKAIQAMIRFMLGF